MSISSSTNRNDYVGNGATDTYNYTFRIFDEGDLEVTVRDTSDVETTLALSTDYTLTGVGSSGGGTIVLVNSAQSWLDGDGDLKSSYALTIRRVLDLVQETDIRNQGAFYPEIHEDQFDKLVMIAQQQQDELSRSASMPVTVAASAFSPEFPASLPSNPGATIIVNTAGDGFELGPTADQISSANADATAAAASAAAALVSETNAGVSETNAAASAASAAAVIAGLTESRAVVTDGSGTLTSASTTATEIGYVSGVTSAIQTQLDAKAPSASPTLTTPSTDVVTIDGQGSTPTSPSSGFYKLYVKDSTNKLTVLDSSGNETSVGSGGGGINLITNGDAESGTTGWATYADAAGTRPVDGTGGSPNVTWTTSSSSPLYGVNSFLFTKDAANRQGQGASYAFTVQPAHQAKVLNISFDYIVSSGTFVAGTSSTDSDIIAYIYDVTNSTLIEPSSIKLLSNSSSIADRFNASFQTSATGTSYRLILHCASTSASAYVVKFDNIQVSPSNYSYGTPITDWQDYSLTIGAVTTAPTQGAGATKTAKFRRIGDSIEIHFNYFQTAAGSAGSGMYLLPLPTGFTIDTSKITVTTNSNSVGGNTLGNGSISSTTTQNSSTACPLIVTAYNTTNLQLARVTPGTSSLNMWGSGDLSMATNPLYVSFLASVPCVGLSSSVQMSDQTDTRVVDMLVEKTSTQSSITANTTKITYDTVLKDSHGMWSSDTATIRVAGDYILTVGYKTATSSTTCLLYKNNSSYKTLGTPNSTYHLVFTRMLENLKVGDTLDLRQGSTENSVGDSSGAYFISLSRIAGPNQIAASETVRASYYCSTNQAATSSAPINFDTKEYDSHGAVTTGSGWKFTAPMPGGYNLCGALAHTTATAHGTLIYKNGSAYKGFMDFTTTTGFVQSFSVDVQMNQGDYIEIRPSANITFSGGALTASGTSHIAIKRIGL